MQLEEITELGKKENRYDEQTSLLLPDQTSDKDNVILTWKKNTGSFSVLPKEIITSHMTSFFTTPKHYLTLSEVSKFMYQCVKDTTFKKPNGEIVTGEVFFNLVKDFNQKKIAGYEEVIAPSAEAVGLECGFIFAKISPIVMIAVFIPLTQEVLDRYALINTALRVGIVFSLSFSVSAFNVCIDNEIFESARSTKIISFLIQFAVIFLSLLADAYFGSYIVDAILHDSTKPRRVSADLLIGPGVVAGCVGVVLTGYFYMLALALFKEAGHYFSKNISEADIAKKNVEDLFPFIHENLHTIVDLGLIENATVEQGVINEEAPEPPDSDSANLTI